jgi:ABC-type sulfate transport system permease component
LIGEYASPRWSLATSGIAAIIAGIFGLITLWNYSSKKSSGQMQQPAPVIEQDKEP